LKSLFSADLQNRLSEAKTSRLSETKNGNLFECQRKQNVLNVSEKQSRLSEAKKRQSV